MKKVLKKVLTMVLAIAMMLSLLPASALAADPEAPKFEDFFTGLASVATVENSETYPLTVSEDGSCLVSTNQGKNGSASEITVKVTKACKLSWAFKASSEAKWDYMRVTVNNAEQSDITSNKGNFSGDQTEFSTYSLEADKGDVVTVGYKKDSSGDKFDDCLYLKDFQAEPLNAVTFEGLPEGASLSVTDSQGQSYQTAGSINLPNGTYSYRAEAFGYVPASGTFTLSDADQTVTVSMERSASYTVAFAYEGLKEGDTASVVVKHGEDVMTPEADGTWLLAAADYTYEVTAEGYKKISSQFTVSDQNLTIPCIMEEAVTFEKFFAGMSDIVTAENDSIYPFSVNDEGTEVYSTNKSSYSNAEITFTFRSPAILSFSYRVSGGYSDKLVVKQNDETLLNVGNGSQDVYAVTADTGDVVTIGYSKSYSYSSSNDDCIYLSGFSVTSLYELRFANMPEGADITLTDGDGQAIAVTEGRAVVPAGTYHYTATAFGYEDKSGTCTVTDQNQNIDLTMTALEGKKLTFEISGLPEGVSPTIVVKHEDLAFEPQADGSYQLVPADYTYRVKAAGYKTVRGEVTIADGNVVVPVTMVEGIEWDGTAGDSFAGGDGTESSPYLISNGEELAYLSAQVEAGNNFYEQYFELTADIDMGDRNPFTPIGTTNAMTFRGYFDGKGHSIRNLYINQEKNYAGLFGYIEKGASVSNLTVYGEVSGKQYVGGIAGQSKGAEFKNCANYAAVTATSTYAGGIIGYLQGDSAVRGNIIRCFNGGTVTNGTNNFTGGIVGSVSYTDISDCYNTADISGRRAGGIAGQTSYTNVANCYNVGTVTLTEEGSYNYAASLIGYVSSGTVSNCYYLEGTAPFGSGTGTDNHEVTIEQMKSMDTVTGLGGAFVNDAKDQNNGYPILAWQDPDAKLIAAFTVNYPDAVIEVKDAEGTLIQAEADGTFRLKSGDYTYTVSRTECEPVSGKFTIAGAGQTIEVTLVVKTYPLTVNVTPQDADVVITDSENKEVQPGDDGYKLPKGTYQYAVSKYGYVAKTGTLQVQGENDSLNVALDEAARHTVSVSVTDKDTQSAISGANIQISHAQAGVMTAETDGTYRLASDTFSYMITAEGYINAKGTFTVGDEDYNLSVVMEQGSNVWTGEISETEPAKDTADGKEIYLITSAEELAWFQHQVTEEGNTAIHARLMTNIVLNSEEEPTANSWNGIGSYSNKFAGTFDGNGKTVTGYYSTSSGFLGYMAEGSSVENLTVAGTISAGGTIGGIVNQCYGTVRRCTNRIDITNSSSSGVVTGGIAGRLYRTALAEECSNEGDLISTTTGNYNDDKVGGIAGDAYCAIRRCSNKGNIDAGNKGYIYAAGIIGYSNGSGSEAGVQISDCYNQGDVSTGAATNAPYVAGIAARHTMGAAPTLKNCYNTGNITSESSAAKLGAIAGDYQCNIENCYYLTGSAAASVGTEREGYAVEAAEKTTAEMKDRSFVLAIGNQAFGLVDNAYPVFLWQGGTAVENSEAANAVAAAKAALTLETTTILSSGQMNLPTTVEGFEGTITWSSDNQDVITDAGVVTLPETGISYVNLTATISLGGASEVSDTKKFVITVKSQAAQNAEILEAAKTWLESTGPEKPCSGDDTNICTLIRQELADQGSASGQNRFGDISVTVADTGTKTYPANLETDAGIAQDGAITYLYIEPTQLSNAVSAAIISNAVFTLTLDGQSVEVTKNVNLEWDIERITPYMEAAAQKALSALDSYKGEDQKISIPETVSELSLPTVFEEYPYIRISWISETDLVDMEQADPTESTVKAVLRTPGEATEVSLTPVIAFTLGENVEIAKWDELTFTLQPQSLEGLAESMQAKLDANYTADKLEDIVSGDSIDPQKVDNDIQLLIPRNTGIQDYDNYRFIASSSDENVAVVNGYRVNIYRPMPDEKAADVTLTITMRHKTKDVQVTKDITLRVEPLTTTELDDAVSLMEQVKAAYWDGINDGANSSIYNVRNSLHAFQEATLDGEGNLVWAYDVKEKVGNGIAVGDQADYSEVGGQEEYNKFKSSNKAVISHENLQLTQPQYHTSVTVESVLEHEIYGKYAEKITSGKWYDDYFSKLYKVPVSATMTVIGTDGEDPNGEKPLTEVNVTVRLTGVNEVGAVDRKVSLTSDKTVAEALQKGLGEEYQLEVSGYGYIGSLKGPDEFNEANKDVQFWGQYIYADGSYDTVSALNIPVKDGAVYAVFANETTDDPDASYGYKLNTWFHQTSYQAETGEVLKPQIYMLVGNSAAPREGVDVYCNGEVIGTTDENGQINVSFDKEGEYLLTIGDSLYTYSQCVVTVEKSKQQIDEEAAQAVDGLIASIGTVTLNSEQAISDARKAYEALSDDQKALVANIEVLVKAEQTLKTLKDQAADIPQQPGTADKPGDTSAVTNADALQVNQIVTVGKAMYKVTSVGKKPTVAWMGTKSKKATVTVPKTVKIKGVTCKVTSIGAKACQNKKTLKKLIIGDNVKKIGANAWKGCRNLKSVTIGKNVTKIGKSAFAGCKNLKKVTIKSKKLKTIGKKAFYGIHKKAEIKLPKSLTKKQKNAVKAKIRKAKTAKTVKIR